MVGGYIEPIQGGDDNRDDHRRSYTDNHFVMIIVYCLSSDEIYDL